MKNLFFAFLITIFLPACNKPAMYNEEKGLISFDSYTIPVNEKGAVVGHVVNVDLDSFKIVLSKDTSGIFQLGSDGTLSLKQEKSVTETSPMRYEIEIDCNGYKKSFEFVKDDFIRNKVIAHRGAWKNNDVSQNSIGSLQKGIELGCEAVEFDVWLSSDNEIVLSHDPVIDEKSVEDTPATELRKIQLKNNENLPTLKEYLDIIKSQNRTRLVLEIKVSQKGKDRALESAEAVVRMIHAEKAQAWVDYISFSYDILLKVRELDKTASLSYLENNKSIDDIKNSGLSGLDYYFTSFYNDSLLIQKSKSLGLSTNAWTVNKEEDMRKLLEAGIDFITTDEPEILLSIQ